MAGDHTPTQGKLHYYSQSHTQWVVPKRYIPHPQRKFLLSGVGEGVIVNFFCGGRWTFSGMTQ